MKSAALCQSAPGWIRRRLKSPTALAPLTGQDARALTAFVHLLDLYVNADGPGQRRALLALHHTVMCMQPSTQHLAKAAIPHVLDWSDEDRLWPLIIAARAIAAEVN